MTREQISALTPETPSCGIRIRSARVPTNPLGELFDELWNLCSTLCALRCVLMIMCLMGCIAWKGAPLSRVANVNPAFNGLAIAALMPADQHTGTPSAGQHTGTRSNCRHRQLVASSAAPTMLFAAPPALFTNLGKRIVQGLELGIAGAIVAAALSAITEPIMNRVRVKRVGVRASVRQFELRKARSFFQTTLSTNLVKFPLYEAINAAMLGLSLPLSVRGAATGAVFTSATLPITNFRQCQSIDEPCRANMLYKAYLPTLARDMTYGASRNLLLRKLEIGFPMLASRSCGPSAILFVAVFGACLASSPGNELRGYYLQPLERRLGFRAFFKPRFYLRSSILGSLIMATGLSAGRLVTAYLNGLLRIAVPLNLA